MSEIWFCHSVLLFSWNVFGSDVQTGIKMQVKICRSFKYVLDIVLGWFLLTSSCVCVWEQCLKSRGISAGNYAGKNYLASKRKGFEWNTIHSWMGILQTGYNSGEDCHRKKYFLAEYVTKVLFSLGYLWVIISHASLTLPFQQNPDIPGCWLSRITLKILISSP